MATIAKNISKNIITRDLDGVCFGEVIYAAQGQYGPLIQRDYQIVLILEGYLRMRVDGEWFEIPPGYLVPLLPGQDLLLLFSRETATRHQWCTLRKEGVEAGLAKRFRGAWRVQPVSEVLQFIMQGGLRSGTGSGRNEACLLRTLGTAALTAVVAAGEADRSGEKAGSEPRRRAERFMRENYGTELNLAQVAMVAGVTPNHLIRLFREQAGVTPMEFLWQRRLDAGVTWLRETGLSVAEIADRAGFQNPFHFSRRFKARFGKSPREYRQGRLGRSSK